LTLGFGAQRVMDGAMSLGELIAAMIVWQYWYRYDFLLNIARLKQTLTTVQHQ
jgi:ABC-type bacteriocin/lantibiotic exporter with double-glycine peptidase domain